MGKEQQLPLQQQQIQGTHSLFPCEGCAAGLSRIGGVINLKCVVLLIFSLSVFLPAVFWVLPRRFVSAHSRFDAKEDIKLKATVQACFRLQKPVSVLIPDIDRLEYDIYDEVGVPSTKVAILSIHQAGASNWTNVVFGVLSDPIDATIKPVYLSVVRSSLIDLFLQQANLTLTTSIFGKPSSFEILKFPGGITVIPEQAASIWQISQNFFNFVLNNSVCDIKEHIDLLKKQMKSWLLLRPHENVFVQVTNKNGSTTELLVTVQAGVISDMGILLPQRLKQLAQRIKDSPPSTNLGLNNTVFGKVKEISLASFLNHTLHATPPFNSPSPAPEQNEDLSPSYPSAPSPSDHNPYSPVPGTGPLPHCGSTIAPNPSPAFNFGPIASPSPSTHAYLPFPGPTPQVSSDLSPSPAPSYGSSPRQKGNKGLVAPPLALPLISPSPSSFAVGLSYERIWVCIYALQTVYLLFWR